MTKSPADAEQQFERRLRELYTEIATLAGGLAHEIKNPLSTIRLNMELLAEEFADSQTPRDRRAIAKIHRVQRECQRLENLLNDFLNFTRPRQFNLQPTDLNAEVQRILEFFRPSAAESGIEITAYLDPELPTVLLDREPFHSALLNLVINAQQAMTAGGQLVVRTRTLPKGVALDLIDTGVGMDEDTRGRIFQTFYSTKPDGSGLGLPTALKVIQGHGGRIDVESEVGRGTKFTIELPVPARLAATPPPTAIPL